MANAPPDSQVAPFPGPESLPFRLVSKTIGTGAYASVRRATPLNASSPVIAVKFINKEHAGRIGSIGAKQIKMETALHKHLGKHQNIIQFMNDGEDHLWWWIAMELADGGDLFDKIEPDQGCGENIAHFYFFQLINAISFMHSRGVAHRDLKPENILLSARGDLKLADFGLAALFEKDGRTRLCNSICGSPPYMAPEVLGGRRSKRRDLLDEGYAPNISDIWGCGVILFVLLVGNTPWDSPTMQNLEFKEYVEAKDQLPPDELWQQLPPEMLSLLRGMLDLDPKTRFTIHDIKSHPWFQRKNDWLSSSGRSANPVGLATEMLSQLRIDFTKQPSQSQSTYRLSQDPDAMDIDSSPPRPNASSHGSRSGSGSSDHIVETPMAEMPFDWERPAHVTKYEDISSNDYSGALSQFPGSTQELLAQDPSFSQFSQTKVPKESLLTLTQAARAFKDVLPPYSMCRCVSALSTRELIQKILDALVQLGVPATTPSEAQWEQWERSGEASVRVKMADGRRQGLNGHVIVERVTLLETQWRGVRFVKASGDPLEWRRFFKNMLICMGDKAVVRPEG